MSFALESIVLAEGVVGDARGSLTLVGYNPLAWVVPSVPAPINVFMIATLQEIKGEHSVLLDADRISISPSVKGPTGELLLAGSAEQELVPPVTPSGNAPEHLIRAVLVIQAPVLATTAGLYTFEVGFEAKGQPEVRGSTRFAVSLAPSLHTPPALPPEQEPPVAS